MPKYTCERCLKEFDYKSGYEKHLSRKKPCVIATQPDEQPTNIENKECYFCHVSFATHEEANKHMNECDEKPVYTTDIVQLANIIENYKKNTTISEETRKDCIRFGLYLIIKSVKEYL